ncbi:MAG: hypothetical protein MJA83_20065 [Gammaproteobacteria bacterium]|nr:hypothetical protein [Gammaproteobacteria bacterium]
MKTATSPASASLVATDSRRRIRSLKDRFAEYAVSIGGVAVIIAVVLIFFYLFLVVLPLFRGAEIEAHHNYPLPGDRNAETTYLAMEEQAEIAVRFTDSSRIYFFRVADGEILAEENLPDSGNNRVSAFSVIDDATGGVVYGFDDGKVLLAQHVYEVSYPDNVRTITPKLEYPLGEELIQADPEGREIISLTAQMDDDAAVFAVLVSTGEIVVTRVELERSFLTDELSLADSSSVVISDLLSANESPRYLLIDPTQNWFYVGGESGEVLAFDIRDQDAIVLNERLQLTPRGERLTVLKFLMGGISLLAGTNTGEVHQWFPVRDDNNKYSVQLVRSFAGSNAPVTDIAIEQRRKGFITAQSNGFAGIHYATSERTLLNERLTEHEIRKISVSPRGNALITLDEHGTAQFWTIDNDFPEISWSALW